MLFTLLHPGDLSWSEWLMILVVGGALLIIIIGLPLGLIGYIVRKIVNHRQKTSESRSP